jgi:hypothetical protein
MAGDGGGFGGCGVERRRRGGAAASGGASLGKSHKHNPGLSFEHGLHWEVAGVTGNPSRGSGGGGSGRRRRQAARGGSGTTARMREREKAEVKREKWLASILTPLRAPAAACGGEEAVERRRNGWPKLGNGGRRRSSVR